MIKRDKLERYHRMKQRIETHLIGVGLRHVDQNWIEGYDRAQKLVDSIHRQVIYGESVDRPKLPK